MARRFGVVISRDGGETWKRNKSATGWPISDVKAKEQPNDYGYTVIVDIGDTMVDVEIPERVLRLMMKDVQKLAEADTSLAGRLQGVQVDHPSSSQEGGQ